MKKKIYLGLAAGVALLALMMPISWLLNLVLPIQGEYSNPNGIFRPLNDPLMSLMFVYPFVIGMALSWLWAGVNKSMKGGMIAKGLQFGFGYWLIATIPGMFITYSSFDVSWMMIATWTISGLIDAMIAGLVFAKLDKSEQ